MLVRPVRGWRREIRCIFVVLLVEYAFIVRDELQGTGEVLKQITLDTSLERFTDQQDVNCDRLNDFGFGEMSIETCDGCQVEWLIDHPLCYG